jgi:hypothetical protein
MQNKERHGLPECPMSTVKGFKDVTILVVAQDTETIGLTVGNASNNVPVWSLLQRSLEG